MEPWEQAIQEVLKQAKSSQPKALVIRADGNTTAVSPTNGIKFSREEVEKLVGGFEVIGLNTQQWMLMDDDGVANRRSLNKAATRLFRVAMSLAVEQVPLELRDVFNEANDSEIVGDVLVCDKRLLDNKLAESGMRPIVVGVRRSTMKPLS